MKTVSPKWSLKSDANFLFIQNLLSTHQYHHFDVLYDYISKNSFCPILMAAILNFFNSLN